MMPCGSCRSVFEIIACTSCAAASMSRSSANWRVIEVEPSELVGWAERGLSLDVTTWRRLFRAWVRSRIDAAGLDLAGADPA